MAPLPATRDQILMTLLQGVYDPESPLSTLRGIPHLLRLIFQLATNEFWWRKCVKLPDVDLDAELVELYHSDKRQLSKLRQLRQLKNEDTLLFFTELHRGRRPNYKKDHLEFPPPKDININMMPFILARNFKDSRLPQNLKGYIALWFRTT